MCVKALSSASDIENPDHDGKWAEEESDESSVDEFDSISNKGGRREAFEACKALAIEGRKAQEKLDSVGERLTKSSDGIESKKTPSAKTKASSSAKTAKKGKIRFKENERTASNQKASKDRERKKIEKKGQEDGNGAEKKEEATGDGVEVKEEKRNKYLDEWLGIKKEVEDTRYQPGKPPPNRLVWTPL